MLKLISEESMVICMRGEEGFAWIEAVVHKETTLSVWGTYRPTLSEVSGTTEPLHLPLLERQEMQRLPHRMKARCFSHSKSQNTFFLVQLLHHGHPAAIRKDISPAYMPGLDFRAPWEMWFRITCLFHKQDATNELVNILQLWKTMATGPVWFYVLHKCNGTSLSPLILEIFWRDPFLTFPE